MANGWKSWNKYYSFKNPQRVIQHLSCHVLHTKESEAQSLWLLILFLFLFNPKICLINVFRYSTLIEIYIEYV